MDKAAATCTTTSPYENDNTLSIHATAVFSVLGRVGERHDLRKTNADNNKVKKKNIGIFLDINEVYTRQIIKAAFGAHPVSDRFRLVLGLGTGMDAVPCPIDCDFQWSEYERIDWDNVLSSSSSSSQQQQQQQPESGKRQQHIGASSYCIRKGLCRKAQMAHHVHRHVCKHADSILKTAIPQTIIIDTWPVWEETDGTSNSNNHHHHGEGLADIIVTSSTLGGSSNNINRRHCLNQCLVQVKRVMDEALQRYEQQQDNGDDDASESLALFPVWILKPSTVNKGAGIQIVHVYEQVVDICWAEPDIREWYVHFDVILMYIYMYACMYGDLYHRIVGFARLVLTQLPFFLHEYKLPSQSIIKGYCNDTFHHPYY
jgi:hypothetical protein